MLAALVLVWWERRLLGFWQDRLGPNRLGPFGTLQMAADVLKLFTKDDASAKAGRRRSPRGVGAILVEHLLHERDVSYNFV